METTGYRRPLACMPTVTHRRCFVSVIAAVQLLMLILLMQLLRLLLLAGVGWR